MSPPRSTLNPMWPRLRMPVSPCRAKSATSSSSTPLPCATARPRPKRRATRCVDLVAVMRLVDLGIEAFVERARRQLGELEQHVDAQAHVRRHHDRNALGDRLDLGALRCVVAGRTDHERTTESATQTRVDERRRRQGEVDRDVGIGQGSIRLVGDGDREWRNSGEHAGVLPSDTSPGAVKAPVRRRIGSAASSGMMLRPMRPDAPSIAMFSVLRSLAYVVMKA